GLRAFPAIRVAHLSEPQKRAFMLADNRIAQLASWDETALRHELEYLVHCDIDFDFAATGFSGPEVNYILERADDHRARCKVSRRPRNAPVVSKPDDVWCLGDHWLRCGPTHPEQVDAIVRRWQAETGADAIDPVTRGQFNDRERALRSEEP